MKANIKRGENEILKNIMTDNDISVIETSDFRYKTLDTYYLSKLAVLIITLIIK